MLGHISFFIELKVFDEAGVLVHGEDNVGHGGKGTGQELGNVHLAVLVDAGLVAGTVAGGISQNLIDVLMLVGVALQGELQEGSIQVQGVLDLASL